jgi:hypothetical protein
VILATRDPSLERRLYALTRRSGECLLWTGNVKRDGRGEIRASGGWASVHRVAWELARGELTRRQKIAQTCGNKLCIALAHLRVVVTDERPLDDERRALVAGHAWIARKAAGRWVRRFRWLREHDTDLVQAGQLGLITAAARFKPGRGATFASWAFKPVAKQVASQARLHLFAATVADNWVESLPLWQLARLAGQVGEGELGPIGRAALEHGGELW